MLSIKFIRKYLPQLSVYQSMEGKSKQVKKGEFIMEINSLNTGAVQVLNNNYLSANETAGNAAETVNPDAAAVYEPSAKTDAEYKPDINKIRQMMAESDRQVENFRRLVEGLFGKQSEKVQWAFGLKRPENFTKADFEMLEVDEETRLAAQKEIEEGGYYSVENTAARILDFAVALSGGDPSKISLLKDAVEKGMKMAEDSWGDKLPEISYQTFDAVMKGFDEWEAAGSASAITLLNKSA